MATNGVKGEVIRARLDEDLKIRLKKMCKDKKISMSKFIINMIEDEVNNQVFLAPSNQTIREFLETFVELYGTKHWGFNNYKANTGLLNNYVYPLIGDKKIQSFSTLNVDQYINKLTKTKNVNYGVRKNAPQYVSPNTIKSVVKLLRCAFLIFITR